MNRDGGSANNRPPAHSMTDLASAKARVDAACDLKELSRVEADVLARANVEHWTKAVRLEFEDHRYAKALELADRIRRAG